jgi:heme/copper-type cytochrome/quinol oxidase subunit 2
MSLIVVVVVVVVVVVMMMMLICLVSPNRGRDRPATRDPAGNVV